MFPCVEASCSSIVFVGVSTSYLHVRAHVSQSCWRASLTWMILTSFVLSTSFIETNTFHPTHILLDISESTSRCIFTVYVFFYFLDFIASHHTSTLSYIFRLHIIFRHKTKNHINIKQIAILVNETLLVIVFGDPCDADYDKALTLKYKYSRTRKNESEKVLVTYYNV